MSHEYIAAIFFGLAIALLALGVHIGLALALAGVLGSWVILGNFSSVFGLLKSSPYYSISVYELSVVPLFILMGMFSLYGGISESAYRAINSWVGRIRGGLGIATVWACTAFGATSGSSVAAASVFTKVSYPEMRKEGYEPHFACASVAVSAGIAMLIPPSLYAVIYGMLAQASIAKMLMAGVLPGILQALTLSAGVYFMALRNPKIAPVSKVSYSWRDRTGNSLQSWPMLVLAAIIIGGIYSGVFTPTEAAAVGAFAALVISVGKRKRLYDRHVEPCHHRGDGLLPAPHRQRFPQLAGGAHRQRRAIAPCPGDRDFSHLHHTGLFYRRHVDHVYHHSHLRPDHRGRRR
jgi:C4-dicarboxylate transporter DctM subunit